MCDCADCYAQSHVGVTKWDVRTDGPGMSSEWPQGFRPPDLYTAPSFDIEESLASIRETKQREAQEQAERDEVARQQLDEARKARRFAFWALPVAVASLIVAVAAIVVSVHLAQ